MMNLRQAAAQLQAVWLGEAEETAVFLRVVTDSRQIQPGDLFVALRGDHFNGHDFVAQALAQGAVGAVVDQSFLSLRQGPLIVVQDTLWALGRLAQLWRQQLSVKVLAITGSSGKTTVKEMVAGLLRHVFGKEHVLATTGNLNNHIGVPLTLLSLTPQHRFAVIEMGMSDFGEIRYLSELAAPDVALINNAQGAHLAALKSIEGVARAKAEIFEGLAESGCAIINADDAYADMWRHLAQNKRQLTFGLQAADMHAQAIELSSRGSKWTLVVQQTHAAVQLLVPGLHNVQNALAAAALAVTCGLDVQQISQGLAQFTGVTGRLKPKTAFNGATLLDDTYNANPQSISAAIEVLAQFPAPRLLILGDMGEVGDEASKLHSALGEYAQIKGIENLMTLGSNMVFAVQAFQQGPYGAAEHFMTIADLVASARAVIQPNSTVLVKGSRFMRMERVVAALEAVPHQEI